jgi:hypothetical protein
MNATANPTPNGVWQKQTSTEKTLKKSNYCELPRTRKTARLGGFSLSSFKTQELLLTNINPFQTSTSYCRPLIYALILAT